MAIEPGALRDLQSEFHNKTIERFEGEMRDAAKRGEQSIAVSNKNGIFDAWFEELRGNGFQVVEHDLELDAYRISW